MDLVIVIAVAAAALLLVELLLPTGGTLAVIGAVGFIVAGIVALGEDSDVADYVGPGLITLGVLSAATFFVVTPKILRAHRDEPVRTGWEELIGREADVREPLDPVGQVWIEGALWRARVASTHPDTPGAREGAGGGAAIRPGSRVLVEKVDGLTLLVAPVAETPTEKE